MAMTEAPAGVVLTTSLQTVYENISVSGLRKTVRVRFTNIDGSNDADITACNFVDASPAGTFASLPVNTPVVVGDGVEVVKVLDPGDVIQASASASGDIVALPEVIFSEAVA